MAKILIVDDEKNLLDSLERILQDGDNQIVKASNGKEAIKKVKKETPQVVVMDIQMPEMDGLSAFKEIKKISPKQMVIMMTGSGTTDTAIEAMKLGAYDYVAKPFDIPKIIGVVQAAIKASSLNNEVVRINEPENFLKQDNTVKRIIGKSSAMLDIYKTIGSISSSDVPVLLIGQSGTGKELVARAIYHNSVRADKQFLAINCAAIPDTLLESELFGYEKGAFTGANERKIGKFEQCNGGTIFLDEIGDMPMQTQAKILRVLQEHELERLGGNEVIKVNVRIISATNKDLKKQIELGKFREDLFYRLNVVLINLPPLKERPEDIKELITYFLNRFNVEFGKKINEIPKETMEKLTSYPWPGNVRELENVIKRAVVMSVGNTLNVSFSESKGFEANPTDSQTKKAKTTITTNLGTGSDDFGQFLDDAAEALLEKILNLPEDNKEREDLLGKLEKILIKKSINKLKGNQVKISKILGITRNTLRSRIAEFGL
jgi:DNA-binding NtrC family response regulator